jgi:hypothetical protein
MSKKLRDKKLKLPSSLSWSLQKFMQSEFEDIRQEAIKELKRLEGLPINISLRMDERYTVTKYFHPKYGNPLLEPYRESKANAA